MHMVRVACIDVCSEICRILSPSVSTSLNNATRFVVAESLSVFMSLGCDITAADNDADNEELDASVESELRRGRISGCPSSLRIDKSSFGGIIGGRVVSACKGLSTEACRCWEMRRIRALSGPSSSPRQTEVLVGWEVIWLQVL